MKFRPILYATDMVIALLKGSKIMTRRTRGLEVFNENPDEWAFHSVKDFEGSAQAYFLMKGDDSRSAYGAKCPYGNIGDVLWVREKFSYCQPYGSESLHYQYEAGEVKIIGPAVTVKEHYKINNYDKARPCLHMPKEAARIFLKITDIRVERLLDISETDAIAEGIEELKSWPEAEFKRRWKWYIDKIDTAKVSATFNPIYSFLSLWEKINGSESRKSNPWVWVIKFERIEKPGDFN